MRKMDFKCTHCKQIYWYAIHKTDKITSTLKPIHRSRFLNDRCRWAKITACIAINIIVNLQTADIANLIHFFLLHCSTELNQPISRLFVLNINRITCVEVSLFQVAFSLINCISLSYKRLAAWFLNLTKLSFYK